MNFSLLVSDGVYMIVSDREGWTMDELYNRFSKYSDIYSIPLGSFRSHTEKMVAVDELIRTIEQHGLDSIENVSLVNV